MTETLKEEFEAIIINIDNREYMYIGKQQEKNIHIQAQTIKRCTIF